MGFNNEGVDDAVKRLKKNKNVLIGGNIGKNKITPNEEAVNDYIYYPNALFDYVDYFVVNVISLTPQTCVHFKTKNLTLLSTLNLTKKRMPLNLFF